jgi:NMD protein affecting ribosome stability and mRNA decay
MTFCPKCGKKGIKGEFCSECAEKELHLVFKDVEIKKCILCYNFMIEHKWLEFKDPEEGIIRAVYSKIKNPRKVVLDITPKYDALKDKPGAEQDIEVEVAAEGQDFIIPAKILFTVCPNCSKIGTEYFEGVLQVRNAPPEVIELIKSEIDKHRNEGVHLTKAIKPGTDVDFTLTSAKFIRMMGKMLAQRYNGELTETARLFSRDRQTGKDIHRISVLFKMRSHRIGDIVEYRGRKVKVTTLGKRVTGIDTVTGKKVFVK